MSSTNFYIGSLRYDPTGRKRKNHALKSTRRKKPVSNGPIKVDQRTKDRLREAQEFKEKYPSMMEQQMKDGTFARGGNTTGKKEPMKYTGTLIKGIATMHKSNAVPVINKEEATDIARMRRG
tara:strand:- start:1926 stop:2291 length:366 start_codon:yes stop_codon:yes gene_type:complete